MNIVAVERVKECAETSTEVCIYASLIEYLDFQLIDLCNYYPPKCCIYLFLMNAVL